MKDYKDYYYYQAKKMNFPARSVFKLKEINEKYSFFSPKRPKVSILDLGAYPGSWSLYILSCFLNSFLGKLYLLDRNEINIEPYFSKYAHHINQSIFFLQKDLIELADEKYEILKSLFVKQKLDFILSDLLSNTQEQAHLNHLASLELIELILPIVDSFLKLNGHFIFKVFDGGDLKNFLDQYIKPRFLKLKRFKPKACRKFSREIYIICFNKQNY